MLLVSIHDTILQMQKLLHAKMKGTKVLTLSAAVSYAQALLVADLEMVINYNRAHHLLVCLLAIAMEPGSLSAQFQSRLETISKL